MTTKDKLDHLTGLHTRGIMDELDYRFSNKVDEAGTWSIAIIDIDHFKLVNDVFGHLEGDSVIRRVANILSRNKRSTDSLIRYGGDEFVFVMPDTEQLKAVNQGERILQALQREVFPEGMEIGLSIGVAGSKSEDNHLADILKRADKALYQAKKGGRGRVSFYEDHKEEKTKKSITFEHFVGRNEELTELRNTLNDTVTGRGNFVVIAGEPGVGKTRLANELEHYSSFKNCKILSTRCDELGTNRPYLLITDPLTEYLCTLSEDELFDLRSSLPDLLPETAELFQNLTLSTSPAPKTDKDSVLRLRMFSEITQIIKWIASRQPVIFTADNLHWISENDFDLLAYLARATVNVPILCLATMRAPTESFPEIEKKLRDLSGIVRYKLISLKALDEEYTRHMVMFALRDPKIPKDILQRLVKKCSGNPLYLKELLLSLRNSGAIELAVDGGWAYQIPDDMSLPASISALMEERLKDLTGDEKEVLCVGSMMPGGAFSLEPISAVLRRDQLEIARTLEKPLKNGLVQEKLLGSSLKYHFIHDTMRTFLYHELSHGIRKSLQSRFGQYYEEMVDGGNEIVIPLTAHHYCDSLNSEKARHFALKTAKQAKAKGAIMEANHWLNKYMLFAEISKENKDEAYLARLELGTLSSLFTDYDKALLVLKEAETLAVNDEEIGNARFQEALLHAKKGDYSTALSLYDEAMQLLPLGKKTVQSVIQRAYMQDLLDPGDKALKLMDEAFSMIQAIEESNTRRELLADYYMMYGIIAQEKRPQSENTEMCLKAIALFRELSDKVGEGRALLNTAVSLRLTSKYETRINLLNDGLKIVTEVGDTHSIMVAYLNLCETHYSAMQYSLARDYCQQVLKMVETTGIKVFSVWAYYYLAVLDVEDKNHSNAKSSFIKSIDLAEELGIINMAMTTRIDLIGMLIDIEEFEEADMKLSQLEADENIKDLSASKMRLLQGFRGVERLKNPSIDRETALKEAEEKLQTAASTIDENPSIQEMEILTYLAKCLHQQNKKAESIDIFEKAEKLFQNHINSIENNHHKEAILNSPIIQIFEDLKKLLS